MAEEGYIKSMYSANYKQVMQLNADGHHFTRASIDTGAYGNLFSGHYFDQNEPHHDGRLPEIPTDIEELLRDKTSRILVIKPLNKSIKEDL